MAGGGARVGARGRGGARVSALRERHVTTHGHMLLHDAEERSGRISGNVAVAASGSRMGCWVGEAGPGRAGGRCHHLRFYKKRVWKVFTSSGKASADLPGRLQARPSGRGRCASPRRPRGGACAARGPPSGRERGATSQRAGLGLGRRGRRSSAGPALRPGRHLQQVL